LHSPGLLLAIVPADTVVEVTRAIHQRYLEEFGKVYGRLPIAIGNIVFQKFVPMFSVLDAARRMAGNFQRLQEGLWLKDTSPEVRSLHAKLGDGTTDYHHPYVLLANDQAREPATDFMTPAGPVVHVSDLGGRKVRYRPNWYDCEMLGASADRFKLHLTEDNALDWHDAPQEQREQPAEIRYEAAHRGSPPSEWPVTLEDFENMVKLWENLKTSERATDASIRNFEHVIAVRREGWRHAGEADTRQAIDGIARSVLTKFTGFDPDSDHDKYQFVLDAVSNGSFDRALNLFLRILKDRLKTDSQQESRDE
jgi:hypothetical protein